MYRGACEMSTCDAMRLLQLTVLFGTIPIPILETIGGISKERKRSFTWWSHHTCSKQSNCWLNFCLNFATSIWPFVTDLRPGSGPGSSPTGPGFWARPVGLTFYLFSICSPSPILLNKHPGLKRPSLKCKTPAWPKPTVFSSDQALDRFILQGISYIGWVTIPYIDVYKRQWRKKVIKTLLHQGCQMVYFQTKNPNLGKFLRALQYKMLIYCPVGVAQWTSHLPREREDLGSNPIRV
jgi:hypothetical protein